MKANALRKSDILASNLLYVWLVVSLICSILRPLLHIVPPFSSKLTIPGIVLITLFYAGFFYAIRLGKRWARILLAILFVGALATQLVAIRKFQTDVLNVTSYVLYMMSHAWALVLVFKRPSPDVAA